MSHSKFISASIKAIFLITVGILIATNPGTKKYEHYASKALNSHLKENLCQEATGVLKSSCGILVDIARPQLDVAIAQSTQRKNFLVFSIYQTHLSLPSAIADYEFETVAILDYFYTYQAEKLD